MFPWFIGVTTLAYYASCVIITYLYDCDLMLYLAENFLSPISSLRNKVVVIVGCTTVLSGYLAKILAEHGVKLVLVAKDRDELERLKTICLTRSRSKLDNDDILLIPLNSYESAKHEYVLKVAIDHFGKVDILVNNIDVYERVVFDYSDSDTDAKLYNANVKQSIAVSRAAIRYFLHRGEGHLAVTSNIAGVIGIPYTTSYCGVKHCLHGYYKSLRNEIPRDRFIALTLFCLEPSAAARYQQESNEMDIRREEGVDVVRPERCGYLYAVALANRLSECWVGSFPVLLYSYFSIYLPTLTRMMLHLVRPRQIFQYRGNASLMKLQTVSKKSHVFLKAKALVEQEDEEDDEEEIVV